MRLSYACYGNANSFVQMQCPWGSKIALRRLAYGAKPQSNCPSESTHTTSFSCCIPACEDCFFEHPDISSAFDRLTNCNGKTACSVRAQRAILPECTDRRLSQYVVMMYECIPEFSTDSSPQLSYNSTMSEEICALPLLNREHPAMPTMLPHTPSTKSSLPRHSSRLPSSSDNFTSFRPDSLGVTQNSTQIAVDTAKEGALIGALVGGVTLLVLVVLAIVICCTVKWKDDVDTGKKKRKKESSFAEPSISVPSYYAYGSVDGSSMAGKGQSDNLSLSSVSTDPYVSVNQNTMGYCQLEVPVVTNYKDRHWDGFAPSKPSYNGSAAAQQGFEGVGQRSKLVIPVRSSLCEAPDVDIVSKRGKHRAKACLSDDRIHRTHNHSRVSGNRRAKDSYYKGKARALRDLSSLRYEAGFDKTVDNPTLSSWWLMGAMRTHSDPITRFQHSFNNKYQIDY